MKIIIKGAIAILFVAIVSSLFCGCRGHVRLGVGVGVGHSTFHGRNTQWRLVEMNGRRIFGMSSGQFTIAFNRNGTISGIGACNRFSGTYTSFGRGSVSIRPGGMTRISCPNMSLENEFIMVLSRANGYRIHSNRMMLLSHGRVIAVLTRRW